MKPLLAVVVLATACGQAEFRTAGSAGELAPAGSKSGQPRIQTKTLVSDTSWKVFANDPATVPSRSLGFAQAVCLNASAPTNCPTGATLYGFDAAGWSADLSSIQNALWIWAPGITGATAPAELAEFFFTKTINIKGTPIAGTIAVAADDFAEVRVNGAVIGTVGSTIDFDLATIAQNSLQSFDMSPYLKAGKDKLTIRGQNGVGDFAGCTNCPYAQNPAALVFGVSIMFEPRAGDDEGNDVDDGEEDEHHEQL